MSRLDELKKQYKDSSLSKLDAFKMVVPDRANKYAELFARIYKAKVNVNNTPDYREKILYEIKDYIFDNNTNLINEEYLSTLSYNELKEIISTAQDFGIDDLRLVLNFCNLNERNLIENSDITSYNSLGQLRDAVALAELKLIDKESAKSVYRVFEDDEWLIIRPLTIDASARYGASTKWCTTMLNKDYFHRYSNRGTLIYNINKKTGYKVACFKNHNLDFENEFSFWNTADTRIDSLDSELPGYVMDVIRQETKKEICNVQLEGYVEPTNIKDRLNEVGLQEPQLAEHAIMRINYENNIGLANANPNTQLAVNGDIEVNGEIRMMDNVGVERMRITSDGIMYPPDIEQTQDNLLREMDQLVGRAAEAVVESRAQQQSLLEGIELGTLSNDYKRRMQMLAGIDPNDTQTEEPQAEQTDVPLVQKQRKLGKSWMYKAFKQLSSLPKWMKRNDR